MLTSKLSVWLLIGICTLLISNVHGSSDKKNGKEGSGLLNFFLPSDEDVEKFHEFKPPSKEVEETIKNLYHSAITSDATVRDPSRKTKRKEKKKNKPESSIVTEEENYKRHDITNLVNETNPFSNILRVFSDDVVVPGRLEDWTETAEPSTSKEVKPRSKNVDSKEVDSKEAAFISNVHGSSGKKNGKEGGWGILNFFSPSDEDVEKFHEFKIPDEAFPDGTLRRPHKDTKKQGRSFLSRMVFGETEKENYERHAFKPVNEETANQLSNFFHVFSDEVARPGGLEDWTKTAEPSTSKGVEPRSKNAASKNVASKEARSKNAASEETSSKNAVSKESISKNAASEETRSKNAASKEARSKNAASKEARSKNVASKEVGYKKSTNKKDETSSKTSKH